VNKLRKLCRWLILLPGSPESISLGLAIGVFVAFTPTIGIQILLAGMLATLLSANRPAALLPVWITNPVTIAPLFGFTYVVGRWFLPGPLDDHAGEVLRTVVWRLQRQDFWNLSDPLNAILSLSRDVFIPLWIGGLLVGLVAAVAVYFPTLFLIRRSRQFLRDHHSTTVTRWRSRDGSQHPQSRVDG
jgi:hypothetical protein